MQIKTAVLMSSVLMLCAPYGVAQGTMGMVRINIMSYAEKLKSMAMPKMNANPAMAQGTLAVAVHPNLTLEAMAAVNSTQAEKSFDPRNNQDEIQSAAGFYLKPKLELTRGLELYARVGVTALKRNATEGITPLVKTGSSISYGLGLAYHAQDGVVFSLDYMSYYRNKNLSTGSQRVEGISVTVTQEY